MRQILNFGVISNMVIGRNNMNYKKYILYVLISLLAMTACNVCDNSGTNAERIPENIYFTSQLLNSEVMSVYGIDPQGDSKDLVRNEGIIYASPSRDGKLAVLVQSDNRSAIELINLKSGNPSELLNSQVADYYIDYGLSGNANALYYVNKLNELNLYDINTKVDTKIDIKVNVSLRPSFSPDSKKLAYLERGNSQDENTLHVVDVVNPRVEYYSLAIPYSISVYNSDGKAEMSWSKDSKSILLAVGGKDSSDSIGSRILQIDLATNASSIFSMNGIYAYEPKFSPDNKYWIFADIEGNIRKAVKTETNSFVLSYLIKGNIEERCQYVSFNSDGSALLYSKRNRFAQMQFAGNLYVTDLKSGINRYLFSNVYAGYWYN